ncbi:MAG: hypothetical protein ACRDRJ_18205, partial [Streptosporangiaceae bacterium]
MEYGEVIEAHRLYLLELMQQWTRLKEGEARDDLGLALVCRRPTASNLLDEFALVEPGQVTAPTQVSILLDASRGSIRGLPSAASVSYPGTGGSGISPAVIALTASVLGLVFTGLVAVAAFTVIAQRRLRALGMLSSLGATQRHVQ